ncbi:VOC family protein [Candidatus Poribacteria bacterium]|nr:VOC family protein [Candidatus Poribacteria bacterium]
MASKGKPIPDGFNTVSAYLVVNDGAAAMDFYKKALGAEEIMRMPCADTGKIMHGELKLGDSIIMLCDEFPEMGGKSPKTLQGTPVTMHVYCEDCDKAFNQAVAAGATVKMPPADMFWGDRWSVVEDPFGHSWSFATHLEDLTPEEIGQRAAAAFAHPGGDCGCGCEH